MLKWQGYKLLSRKIRKMTTVGDLDANRVLTENIEIKFASEIDKLLKKF